MEAGAEKCQWALTRKQTLGAGAHLRLSIFVCGRISTSLSRPDMFLPLLVSWFAPKLQARSGTVRHQASVSIESPTHGREKERRGVAAVSGP